MKALLAGRADALEVVPRGEVADERLGVEPRQFLFADRERDHRDVFRRDLLVAELLVERHVGVAVDRRDDRGLLAGRAEALDRRDARLPVGVAERRVVDRDVGGGDALRLEVRLEDAVGRARVDVVGALEHPPRHADLLHQVVDGRDRLLVGRSAGVDDVLRRLLTFVLHRVEQQAVVLLEDRQHRLARHRRPAAEDDGDLVLLEQLARLLGEQRPVGGRIDDHRFELAAEQPALLFCSSIIIRMVSFSVVSLMAIVPDSECRMPILIGAACAPIDTGAATPQRPAPHRRDRVFQFHGSFLRNGSWIGAAPRITSGSAVRCRTA